MFHTLKKNIQESGDNVMEIDEYNYIEFYCLPWKK